MAQWFLRSLIELYGFEPSSDVVIVVQCKISVDILPSSYGTFSFHC